MIVYSSQSHANELIGNIFHIIETDNLPVEFTAVRSGLAANDDHERHAALSRLRPPLVE